MGTCCDGGSCSGGNRPLEWFGNMIGHCYEYATRAKEAGRGVGFKKVV